MMTFQRSKAHGTTKFFQMPFGSSTQLDSNVPNVPNFFIFIHDIYIKSLLTNEAQINPVTCRFLISDSLQMQMYIICITVEAHVCVNNLAKRKHIHDKNRGENEDSSLRDANDNILL